MSERTGADRDRLTYALQALGHRDAYQVLGAEPGDDLSRLRRAYRRRMRVLHPDAGGDQAEAQLANIAWHLLRTDRDGYDRYRAGLGLGTDDGDLAGDRPFVPAEGPWSEAESWEPAPDDDARPNRPGAGGGGPATEADEETRRQWEDFERDLRRSREPRRTPARRESTVVPLPLVALLGLIFAAMVAIVGGARSTGGTTYDPNLYGGTRYYPNRYYPTAPYTYPSFTPHTLPDPYGTDHGKYLSITRDPYASILESMLASITAVPHPFSSSTRRP